MISRFFNSKGLTLVEIMMAVSILAFIILPVVGLLNYSNRGTREQDAEGIAANLAKEEMNRLMYVVTRENLLEAEANPTTWSLGADYDVKGNKFSGEFSVYPHSSSDLSFSVPQFKFHDPQKCSGGYETDPGNTLESPEPMTLAEVYPDSASECRLADILLVVKWRVASEDDYDPRNQFKLIARRAFLVTE